MAELHGGTGKWTPMSPGSGVTTKRLTPFTPDTGMGGVKPRPPGKGPAAKTSGRNKTDSLQYPLNVESDEQQGHYIIFEIMQQDKSKLASQKAIKSVTGQADKAQKELNTKKKNMTVSPNPPADSGGGGMWSRGKAAFKGKKQSGPNSIQVKQAATTAMDTVIALYMPPSVQVSYGAKWNEQEIGVMAESVNAGIQAFMNTGGGMGDRIATGVGTGLGGLVSGAINEVKSMMPAGGEAIFAINSGSIITPRMELMFEGISRRSFSFNFTFIPKSAQEADIVEQIVKKFKYHMSSNYGSNGMGGVDGVREMEIPDFFNIRYMYRGAENSHLNKIKQCVLATAQIDYGAERYVAFENGQPQTTKLALTFNELEFITKDYVGDGY